MKKVVMSRIVFSGAALFAAWCLFPGCAADPETSPHDALGVARAAVNNVPNDGTVACITVTATGSWATTQAFDVMPGQSTVFTINGIPTGTVRFDSAAYPTACAQVLPTDTPTWVSLPVLTSVVVGQTTAVALNLQPSGGAGIGVGFNPAPQCRATGLPCLAGNECCSGACGANNTCVASGACPPGQTSCNGLCVDLQTNTGNCGACGNQCPDAGFSCVNGACVSQGCGVGLWMCGGACVDIFTDPQNCGACGLPCPGGFACFGGFCAPAICGDGVVSPGEGCDDGNGASGDGCSAACVLEPGWVCFGQPSLCNTICGDGIVAGNEQCDDGNSVSFDGCSKTCQLETSCSDALKNGAETDIDCGGPSCPRCAAGKSCVAGADCTSSVCHLGVCALPSCADGVKNGAESDVDCGIACMAPCASGKQCSSPVDCLSGSCLGGICL